MITQTSELKGEALNFMVAKAEGRVVGPSYSDWVRSTFGASGWSESRIDQYLDGMGPDHAFMRDQDGKAIQIPNYAAYWAHGGPILEGLIKQCLTLSPYKNHIVDHAKAQLGKDGESFYGEPLEAAMRCYVYSKFGHEVDLPDVLLHRMQADLDKDNQKRPKP